MVAALADASALWSSCLQQLVLGAGLDDVGAACAHLAQPLEVELLEVDPPLIPSPQFQVL